MSELKKWIFVMNIEQAHGTQSFLVEAATEKEARELFKYRGGDYIEDDIEVTELSKNPIDVFEQSDGL